MAIPNQYDRSNTIDPSQRQELESCTDTELKSKVVELAELQDSIKRLLFCYRWEMTRRERIQMAENNRPHAVAG